MKPKILLVDDEVQLLAQMRWVLDADYEIKTATSEEDALNAFSAFQPSVAVVDLCLNRTNPLDLGGLRLIDRFLEQQPATRIIVVTGNEDDTNALRAVRLGAYDYYSKPIRLTDLKVMIQRAIEVSRIHQRLPLRTHLRRSKKHVLQVPRPREQRPCRATARREWYRLNRHRPLRRPLRQRH